MIRNNAHKYSVSAMCEVLQIARSTYYFEAKERDNQDEELAKMGWILSRHRIGRIMNEQGLVSKYTIAKYKPYKTPCNESEVGNVLNREFERDQVLEVVVSDLTYVRVENMWHYICLLTDLFNREIIGYSTSPHKTSGLVQRAFASVPYNLKHLKLFHTDRGSEFKNHLIDKTLDTFCLERSLSEKGTPYDNVVAEAMFKTIKTEFINGTVFPSQQVLDLELFDYVNWFNNIRIHGSLDYLTPMENKFKHLNKNV